jgi:hypothetical protein
MIIAEQMEGIRIVHLKFVTAERYQAIPSGMHEDNESWNSETVILNSIVDEIRSSLNVVL